jgi:DNA-binding CsgD family transcriptional regulator
VPAVDRIRLAFALTASEARLASGEPLRAAAEAEGITWETARTRLKAILHKTGTTRQAQLPLLLAHTDTGPQRRTASRSNPWKW